VGPVPPLPRYYEVLRLLSVRPAALRCLRLAVPRVRHWFALADERRVAGEPGLWSSVPRPTLSRGDVQVSQVPGGTPLRACPALRPRRDLGARPPGASMQPSARSTASAPAAIKLTGLHHTACTLPVYASQQGSLPNHATLGSGWRPTFAGWGWLPTGSPTKGFCRHPSCMASALPRLFLAQ